MNNHYNSSYSDYLIQTDVESLMVKLGKQLEEGTEDFSKLAEEKAIAEAEYKERYWTALVKQIDSEGSGMYRLTAPQKEARASLAAREEFRRFKLMEAREKAAQQFLITIRARLDSLRTIAANVRASGG